MDLSIYFEAVSKTLSGTCLYTSSPISALRDACYSVIAESLGKDWGKNMHDISIWAESLEQALLTIPNFEGSLDVYINDVEQFSCPECGWWVYPGESMGYNNDKGQRVCLDCCEDYEE